MLNRLRNLFLLRWEWSDGSMNSLQADSLQVCWRHMGVVGKGPRNGSETFQIVFTGFAVGENPDDADRITRCGRAGQSTPFLLPVK